MMGERVTTSVDYETRAQIENFIAEEAALLDARQIAEWLDLTTDDFTYKIPTTQTTDSVEKTPWNEEFLIIDEDKLSIAKLWTPRYSGDLAKFAWGENPPQRTRRFVSTIRIRPLDSQSYEVHANVLLSFTREAEPSILMPTGRRDVLRRVGDTLKLASRVVFIDQRVLTTGNLRLII
ncbi:aromatic-ring-hydroxylating dioxygenase subunit beta [Pseudomonas sp. H11T01]|uniref:aromatic-ring-hydroxylating dioxygenase subunit beta n=1 Tax=Pseudomonas sp. H11T01 TaxID=3402749 RepID=UPI003AD56D88